jgi:curli biogenesis system outer membrane secretion channel CsgG
LILFVSIDAKEVKSSGEGGSLNEAIYDALTNAISMVNGVALESIKESKFRYSEFNRNNRVSSIGESSSRVDIKSATGGYVNSYKILSQRRDGDGGYVVKILADIPQYKSVSKSNRRKMAILPFRISKSYFEIDSKRVEAKEVERQLNQSIVSSLTQSRKFAILDRDFTKEQYIEKSIIAYDSPLSEQIKLGQSLGSDYMLVGVLSELSLTNDKKVSQITSQVSYRYLVKVKFDYRVIVMATREIKYSDSIDWDFEVTNEQFKLPYITDWIAKEINITLLDNIYPMRVVNVSNGFVTLNQGGNSLEIGDELKIFNIGKKLIDPYSKEVLGRDEKLVAIVKIVDVGAKISKAEIIEKYGKIKSDATLRRILNRDIKEEDIIEEPSKESDVELSESGGVRLPFDR